MNTDFPVVDAHVHVYPDSIAAKVTANLGARFGNEPVFEGTSSACAAHDSASSISASLNLPVATSPHQVESTDKWAAELNAAARSACGARVFSLAALHPDVPDMPSALSDISSAGFTGVKFHPEYQNFRFNDEKMDPCWEEMSALGLAAFLHAGGERVFKPPFHSSPSEIRDLHRRFPKLRIIAAHLGGFGMWDESEAVLCGEDVYLDLSHTFFWMDDAQILRMIRKHGAHRILFGSDAPWQDPAKVLEAFMALPLGEEERRAICAGNAVELFRLNLA